MRPGARAVLLACFGVLALSAGARAQPASGLSPSAQALGGNSAPGGVGAPGGSSGFGRHGDSGSGQGVPEAMPELKPIVAPRQRLDAGALLCHTEDQLRQRQAAIRARLAGGSAPEPGGCHIVGETIAVAVLRRDGQALTQVQIGGDAPFVGWTDSVVRDADPLRSASPN